jgi:hypothetical protein
MLSVNISVPKLLSQFYSNGQFSVIFLDGANFFFSQLLFSLFPRN